MRNGKNKTTHFLTSRPTPSRRLSNPRAPNYSPAPGRGMSGQAIKFARHPPSLPGFVLLAAYPHHRRHLSSRAVLGSSSIRAAIAPPRRTPGKTPSAAASLHGNHPTPRSLDKQDETKDGSRGWRAVPLVASLIVPRCLVAPVLLVVSVAVPPHIARRGFPSRGGGNSRGGHIFRAVFLSSSYPPRLIASSVPRLSVPSGQASRQGKTAGGHRRFSPPSSYPSPGPSSPRLAPRVVRAGRRASRSRRFRAVIVLVHPRIVRRG